MKPVAVANDAAHIEATAIRLLALREHSRYELQRKLTARYTDNPLLEQILDALQARDLLSDKRFTQQYSEQRIRKGYGPLRIRAELEERGIQSELMAPFLDLPAAEWQEQLQITAQRKFGEIQAQDQREQARRARFLQARGFPGAMIRHYLWD